VRLETQLLDAREDVIDLFVGGVWSNDDNHDWSIGTDEAPMRSDE
jgi:hypothetical protein